MRILFTLNLSISERKILKFMYKKYEDNFQFEFNWNFFSSFKINNFQKCAGYLCRKRKLQENWLFIEKTVSHNMNFNYNLCGDLFIWIIFLSEFKDVIRLPGFLESRWSLLKSRETWIRLGHIAMLNIFQFWEPKGYCGAFYVFKGKV